MIFSLYLLGEGNIYTKMQKLIEEQKLSITIINWLTHQDLPGYLNEIKLLIITVSDRRCTILYY
jgi:hypothetical protein